MAIDYTDLTSIADTLKYVYGDGIRNQFSEEAILYNLLPKSDKKPGGLGYQFGISYADPQGVGARVESGILPDPLVGKFDKALVQPKYVYGALRLTGPALEAGKGNVAAFVDSQTANVEGLYRSIVWDMNRQAWGDGFGKLGVLSAASDTLSTSATWTATFSNDLGVRWFRPGRVVDFYASNGAIDQSSVASRVSSVNVSTKVVTFEANDGTYKTNHPLVAARSYTIVAEAVPSAATCVAVGARGASFATSDTPIEMTGLAGIFDDGTLLASFQDITVSSNPMWKANILSNSDVERELSLDLLIQAVDQARITSGVKPNVMYLGLNQRRKYANLLLGDVRFQPGKLQGGFETLSFAADGTIDMVIDPIAPPNQIFITTKDAIQKFELKPLGWLDYDQAMHMRSGYDEWDMLLALYTNLGVEKRNVCTLLDDLAE